MRQINEFQRVQRKVARKGGKMGAKAQKRADAVQRGAAFKPKVTSTSTRPTRVPKRPVQAAPKTHPRYPTPGAPRRPPRAR